MKETDKTLVTFKPWKATHDALQRIQAFSYIATNKKESLTSLLHRIVIRELERLENDRG